MANILLALNSSVIVASFVYMHAFFFHDFEEPGDVVEDLFFGEPEDEEPLEPPLEREAAKPSEEQIEVKTPWGRISYYPLEVKFVATCYAHEDLVKRSMCRLQRTARPSPCNRARGRPIGLLMAWLLSQEENRFSCKADHRNPFVIRGLSFEKRVAARNVFFQSEGAVELQIFEQRLDGESEEEPLGMA